MDAQGATTSLDDLIKKYGDCYKKTENEDGFFAHSLKEDMFLAGGGRYMFDFRLEWNLNGKYIVAYIKNDTVIRLFE
jgi:hypothetical protein